MATDIVKAETMSELEQLGKALAGSGYFQDANKISQAIVKVLAGREMGFGPIAAMTGIHIIKGRPSIGANLMAAAVKAHPRYNYRVKVMQDDVVTILFFEDGQPCGESTFTAQDAQRAGTQNMGKFPRNMLFARAMSNGVRWYCPDVFMGNSVYTPDELGATVDDDGSIVDMPTVTVETPPPPEDDAPAVFDDDQLDADIAHAGTVNSAIQSVGRVKTETAAALDTAMKRAQEKSAKVERPADAETVRGWLRESAWGKGINNRPEVGDPCAQKQAQQVAALFGKALVWDGADEADLRKARLLTYQYIFASAVTSSHEMSADEAAAVIRWMGGGYEPREPALSEARFLYHAAQVAAGQLAMDIDEAQA